MPIHSPEQHETRAALRGSAALDADRIGVFVASVVGYAISTLDVEGRITGFNAGAEQMTGYRAEELIGAPAARLYAPEDVEAGLPAHAIRRAEAEGRFEGERFRVRK